MSCDVTVIGGGVIGLSCAWRLAQRGVKVQLFERGEIGREASWAAAGMLAAQCEAAVHPASRHAEYSAFFNLCLQSREMYTTFAAELLEASGIDIELSLQDAPTRDSRMPGILYMAGRDGSEIEDRFWKQKEHGFSVEATEFHGRRALWLKDEGQVEPRQLIAALKQACEVQGVVLLENHAAELDEVLTQNAKILLCAGAWSSEISGEVIPPVRPVAGEVLALQPSEPLDTILYSRDVYLVPRRDSRVLIGATVDERGFDKSLNDDARFNLLSAARTILPAAADWKILDHWSGLRPATHDGLPILGSTQVANLFIATGHFRNGILLTPITAQLMADCIIEGIEPPEDFSVNRFAPGVLAA